LLQQQSDGILMDGSAASRRAPRWAFRGGRATSYGDERAFVSRTRLPRLDNFDADLRIHLPEVPRRLRTADSRPGGAGVPRVREPRTGKAFQPRGRAYESEILAADLLGTEAGRRVRTAAMRRWILRGERIVGSLRRNSRRIESRRIEF